MSSKFQLISKTTTSFIKYKGDAVRLTLNPPAKVDEVIVALKDNENLKRRITTFRDSQGNIIERNFDYFDKPYRQRIHTKQPDYIIGNDEYVLSDNVKELELDREVMELYRDIVQLPRTRKDIFWMPTKSVTNHLAINDEKDEKILSQVKIEKTKTPGRRKHSFIEYPPIKSGKIQNVPKKVLTFRVNTNSNEVINHSVHTENVQKPVNDKYLAYRAIPITESKKVFTNKAVSDRGLNDAEIKIIEDYNPIDEKDTHFKAKFIQDDGEIRFNKDHEFTSKGEVVSTSYHEVEHGWQFYLQGRYKRQDNIWQQEIYEKFGELKEPELINEAAEYDKAIENYVPYYVNRVEYNKNLIERKAKQKGADAQNDYEAAQKEISSQFPHIPVELL